MKPATPSQEPNEAGLGRFPAATLERPEPNGSGRSERSVGARGTTEAGLWVLLEAGLCFLPEAGLNPPHDHHTKPAPPTKQGGS